MSRPVPPKYRLDQSVALNLPIRIVMLTKRKQLSEEVAKEVLKILSDGMYSNEYRQKAVDYAWEHYYKDIPEYSEYGNKTPLERILDQMFGLE